MAKPSIFYFPDYVSNNQSNRYGVLKGVEEAPTEPWKIPSPACLGNKYYTPLVRKNQKKKKLIII